MNTSVPYVYEAPDQGWNVFALYWWLPVWLHHIKPLLPEEYDPHALPSACGILRHQLNACACRCLRVCVCVCV